MEYYTVLSSYLQNPPIKILPKITREAWQRYRSWEMHPREKIDREAQEVIFCVQKSIWATLIYKADILTQIKAI